MTKREKKPWRGALMSALLGVISGCMEARDFFGGGLQEVASAPDRDACIVVTKGQPLQAVKACERGAYLELITPAWQRRFRRDDIYRVVTDLYTQFETDVRLGPHGLWGAAAEVWIDVALLDPNDVAFVVLFRTKGGFVMLREPLELRLWDIDPKALVFIPEFSYPSRKARKMGILQLIPHHDIKATQVERLLSESGIRSPDGQPLNLTAEWPYVFLRTELFAEKKTVEALFSHPRAKDVLADILYLPMGEREGAKQKLMSFELMSHQRGI